MGRTERTNPDKSKKGAEVPATLDAPAKRPVGRPPKDGVDGKFQHTVYLDPATEEKLNLYLAGLPWRPTKTTVLSGLIEKGLGHAEALAYIEAGRAKIQPGS